MLDKSKKAFKRAAGCAETVIQRLFDGRQPGSAGGSEVKVMRKFAVTVAMSVFWSIGYVDLLKDTIAGIIIGIIVGCAFAALDSDLRGGQ